MGFQNLEDITDTYYYSDQIEDFYCKYKISLKNMYNINFYNYNFENKTTDLLDDIVNWHILSNYIIETKNENVDNNLKVLFFYDSFLVLTLVLYMKTFKNCIFIKNPYDKKIVLHYEPDYILEYSVERFLNKTN